MSSSINNFVSPFFTDIFGNDANESELQKEIDDLREDLDNNYYTKIESDDRYLNQNVKTKWVSNNVDGTIYPRDISGFATTKVAIGKITSNYNLDISGTTRTNDLIVTKIQADNTFGTNNQVLHTDGSKVYWSDISTTTASKWSQNGNNIYYNNGNVGVNNSNPSYKLDVSGSAKLSNIVDKNNSIGIGKILHSTSNGIEWSDISTATTSKWIQDETILRNISSTHKIGINKNPSYELDVSGNFKANTIVDKNNSIGVGKILHSTSNGIEWSDISSSTASKWVQDETTLKNISSTNIIDISGDIKLFDRVFTKKALVQTDICYNQTSSVNNNFSVLPSQQPAQSGVGDRLLGTINVPSHYNSFINLSYNYNGQAYVQGSGNNAVQGGIKINDASGILIHNDNIVYNRQNIDDQGTYSYNISGNFTTNESLNYPLSVFAYVYQNSPATTIKWITFTSTLNFITDIPSYKYENGFDINVSDVLKTDVADRSVDISGELHFGQFKLKQDISGHIFKINKADVNFMKMENYNAPTIQSYNEETSIPIQLNGGYQGVDNVLEIQRPSGLINNKEPYNLTFRMRGIFSQCNGAVCANPQFPLPQITSDVIRFELTDKFYNLIAEPLVLSYPLYNVNDGTFDISMTSSSAIYQPETQFPLRLRYRKIYNSQPYLQLEENSIFNLTLNWTDYTSNNKTTFSGDLYASDIYGNLHPTHLSNSFGNYSGSITLGDSINFHTTNKTLTLGANTHFDGSNNKIGIGVINPSANLDVSGTANITGNLSVDTNTLFVDATNNRVGIGKTTPSHHLDVSGVVNSTFLRTNFIPSYAPTEPSLIISGGPVTMDISNINQYTRIESGIYIGSQVDLSGDPYSCYIGGFSRGGVDSYFNTAVGIYTDVSKNKNGATIMGYNAMALSGDSVGIGRKVRTGLSSVFVGSQGGGNLLTTGAGNTCVGTYAGYNLTTGSNNVALGLSARFPSGDVSNCLNINNQTNSGRGGIYGINLGSNTFQLGINKNNPSATLDVSGNIKTNAGSTTMTNGFVYIPSSNDKPTGVPTSIPGCSPLFVDTSNNNLWAYCQSGWRGVNLNLT